MSNIKGTIVSRCRDEFGEIIIADRGTKRCMYFGGGVLQSSIRLDRPGALVEEYNHAMMSALLFRGCPRSVLMIGLGGCSLVNFLLKAFPDCVIDVVELRRQVIDLARDFFILPGENPNLKIFHASGQDFVQRSDGECGTYDLILIDAFDDSGPAAALTDKRFLTLCRTRLNKDGIFAVNLWNGPEDNFPGIYARLLKVFGNNALRLFLAEAYQNAIVFGFDNPEMYADLSAYKVAAKDMQKKYNVNFPRYLRQLYWQNFNPDIQRPGTGLK